MSPIAMSQCVECDSQSRVSAPHRTAQRGLTHGRCRAAAYGDASWRVAGGLGVGRKRHRPLSSQIAPAGRPRAAPLPRSAYADGHRQPTLGHAKIPQTFSLKNMPRGSGIRQM